MGRMKEKAAAMGLFDPRKAARTEDVDTSHSAARSMSSAAGQQHAAILQVMRDNSAFPLAPEQVEDALGFPVWRRFSELERAGRIYRTAQQHKNRSGRKAYKFALWGRSHDPKI